MNLVKDVFGIKDAPPPPDYTAAANATAAGNLEAAKQATLANRVNQYTPYGNLTYSANPNGTWNQYTNLNSTGQGLLDQQNKTSMGLAGLQDNATARVGASMNSAMPSAYDPTQASNSATANIMSRVNPQLDRQQNAMETQLTNQGLTRGSEAWKNAETDFGYQRNDANQQAALQGINLGQSQQSQQYQQQMTNRNAPINELGAIRSGSQVTNPTFGGYAQQATTGGPDLMGAAQSQYGAELGQNNANNGFGTNLMNGLFSLGSSAAGAPRKSANFGG